MTENCAGKYLYGNIVHQNGCLILTTLSILINPICKYLEWSFNHGLTDTDNYT